MTAPAVPRGAVGAPVDRIEGREKVTGQARYAFEQPVEGVAYCAIVQARIATGRVTGVDARAIADEPDVLGVLWHENAPRVERVPDGELYVLQSPEVHYRGQIVAAVVADSFEAARDGAARLEVAYEEREHDVVLREDHPRIYRPEQVNGGYEPDTGRGDADGALAAAEVRVVQTYRTPAYHNNPMEPHASLALWEGGDLVAYDSTQGAPSARATLAKVFGLAPERVRVISHHVGGGFGSKGTPRPQLVLAAMAAKRFARPVKVALSRQQMFSLSGYRTPTIQRVSLGAARDGRIAAIAHDTLQQTSTVREFTEQSATPTRVMYAGEHRRTTHRVVTLDVPTPSWMRAPGECPGMFALESAMDELAEACALDPIELRRRNEPATEPESGRPFSSRHLIECLEEGAARFGWAERPRAPRSLRDGRWLVGLGVAASTYPAYRSPSRASVRAEDDGTYLVRVGAADIGTGARTVLAQIAADTLGVGVEAVRVEIGDSALPRGPVAGGSMGTASWGSAVVRACEALRSGDGRSAEADTTEELKAREPYARHAFGAEFAEVRVHPDTGEIRVPRLLGVFAVGRVMNAKTARSQFVGGMTMGLGMALLEQSVMDVEFGDYLNHDLAQYHVPACADVVDVEAAWLEEEDPHLNPMGSKGIGEIGIVGTAAAIANAAWHATGRRFRELPIQPDKLVG